MFKSILLPILSLSMLVSCQEGTKTKYVKAEPVIKTESVIVEKDLSPKRDTIFEDTLIKENIFLADLRKGDKVWLTMSGMRYTPTFDEDVLKDVYVEWNEELCIGDDDCEIVHRSTMCKGQYTERLADKETKLDMINHKNHSLRVLIGEFEVDLGTPLVDKDKFKFSFVVTENMLGSSDELHIKILAPTDVKEVKTGFQKLVDCPANGDEIILTEEDSSFETKEYFSVEEFNISAGIDY